MLARPLLRCAGAAVAGVLLTGCAGHSSEAVDGPASSTPAATTAADRTSEPPGTPSAPTPSGPELTEVDVVVTDGRVTTADDRVSVPRGTRVAFVVTSDVADELHLHGYDVEAPLEPDVPARIEVVADQSGVFELETHDGGLLLLQLEVA